MVSNLFKSFKPFGQSQQQWLSVFLLLTIILFIVLERSMGLETARSLLGIVSGTATVLYALRSRIEIERTTFVALFLFLFMGVLSFSSSSVFEESLFALVHYFGLALCFVLAFSLSLKEESYLEWFSSALLLVGTLYVGYFFISGIIFENLLTGGKLIGSFTWHNQMAAFILYLIPLVFGFAWKYRNEKRAIVFIGLAVLHGVALLLTYSRGAWLSLAITGCLAVILGVRPRSIPRRTYAIFGAALVFIVLLIFQVPSLQTRMGAIVAEFSAPTRSISGDLRLASIRSAWQMVQDYPITGVGIGAYGAANYVYQSEPWLYARDTHNHYFQMLAEMGWPGLVSFGMQFVILGFFVLRFIRSSFSFENHSHHLWFALVLGLIASMLHNIVDFDWNWVNLSLLFWITAGIVSGYAIRYLSQKQSTTILSLRKPITVFSIFVILLSGWLFWYQRELKVGRQFLLQADIDNAIIYLENAASILPISYKSHLDLGFAYRRLEQYELSSEYYQKSTRRNPYVAESWFGRGVITEETEGILAATPYYQKAVTLNPYSHPRSHSALARMFHQQFDYETAASILHTAVNDYYPINENYRQMETVFKSTTFNTEVVNLYAYYAEVLLLIDQDVDARFYLDIAQNLDPNNLRVKLVENLLSS